MLIRISLIILRMACRKSKAYLQIADHNGSFTRTNRCGKNIGNASGIKTDLFGVKLELATISQQASKYLQAKLYADEGLHLAKTANEQIAVKIIFACIIHDQNFNHVVY